MKRNIVGYILIAIPTLLLHQGATQAQTTETELGDSLFFDQNLSLNSNQACSSCHDPDFGFVDPDNVLNGTPVSNGSITSLTGGLNSPSAAYAAFSPFFHWEGDEGLYEGGQFWNGRANTLADQAAGPFLNPVEMAMPDKWSVVDRMRTSTSPDYQTMFADVYNIDLSAISPYTGDYVTPVDPANFPPGVLETYDRMAKAIGEFKKTEQFTKFDSKFDYYLAGLTTLTKQEDKGRKLFNQQGKCALCHLPNPTLAPDGVSQIGPIFTNFTYDNLGVPQNVNIPGQPIDPGLGGRADIAAKDPAGQQLGKHKVMTLRNIELTPPYAHNGVFADLKEIVHFYNTRDTLSLCVDNNDPGFGVTCWPAPEVPQNVNVDELGDLKLTADQEADIVAFMKTLSDGWGPANGMPALPRPPMPYPDPDPDPDPPPVVAGCEPMGAPGGNVTNVSPGQNLASLVSNASAGETFALANGTYFMTQNMVVTAPNVTVRSASGDPASVVIDGNYNQGAAEVVYVNAPGFTVAEVTIQRVYHHPIHVVSGGDDLLVYRVNIIDAREHFLKGNSNVSGSYADNGTIACSNFKMTDAGRSRVENSCYTGGIDVHSGQGWTVRDSTFEGIWCNDGLAEHAVLFWSQSRDTVVERNYVHDCARGIGFGLSPGSSSSAVRTYPDNPLAGTGLAASDVMHIGGVVRNNFVSSTIGSNFDTGIGLEAAYDAEASHNSVWSNNPSALQLDVRFPGSQSVVVAQNLAAVSLRDNPQVTSINNMSSSQSMFANSAAGDLHLVAGASPIDAGQEVGVFDDIDLEMRDAQPDIGADEFGGSEPPPLPTMESEALVGSPK